MQELSANFMEHSLTLQQMTEARLLNIQLLKDCAERVMQSTIQFFFFDSKSKYPAAGNGVLCEINDRYFVFTAAHVFTDHHQEIYVISNQKAISLGGIFYTTPLPNSGDRADDKIDLAIIAIDNSAVTLLKAEYIFISLVDLELGHFVDVETNYLIAGHPITRTKKVWNNRALKSQAFVANLDALIRFNYEKFKFKFESHIAMDYAGEIISLKNHYSHLAPKLVGISGSGLWYLRKDTKEGIFESRLIGIVIEQIKENGNKAVIATRIDIIVLFLNKLLNLDIPIPKKINKYQ